MGRVLVPLLLSLAVLTAAFLLLLPQVDDDADVPFELLKAVLSLMTAVLVTGVLSFAISRHQAAQARRDERARVLSAALQGLKAGYERIQVARYHLRANCTAGTFLRQIDAIAEARSLLHRVQRERFIIDTPVDAAVQRMLNALDGVAEDYRRGYPLLTRLDVLEQRLYGLAVAGHPAAIDDVEPLPADEFPHVHNLIGEDTWKEGAFHQGYREAKRLLQAMLERASR